MFIMWYTVYYRSDVSDSSSSSDDEVSPLKEACYVSNKVSCMLPCRIPSHIMQHLRGIGYIGYKLILLDSKPFRIKNVIAGLRGGNC